MDRYLILERFILEKENLIEQLIPVRDWDKSPLGMTTDQLYNAIKSGRIKPKLGVPRASLPFYKTKTAKLIGTTVLVAAIIALAYKIYKKYYNKGICDKIKDPEQKELCLKKQRVIAFIAQKQVLENMKKECVKSLNPEACKNSLDEKIRDLDSKIKSG